MVRKELRIALLRNEILQVKFGSTIGDLASFKKRIEFSKGTQIVNAQLDVTGQQTYLSGADISVTMNGRILKPRLMWHALENGVKSIIYNVTTDVANGINTFSGLYTTAFGVLSDQRADLSMTLVLDLLVEDFNDEGASVGGTAKPGQTRAAIAKRFEESFNVIVGALVITAVAVSGVYIVNKKTDFNLKKMIGF
jgi:hypothetical protein